MAHWSQDDLAAQMSSDCRKLNAHLLGLDARPRVGLTTKAALPTEPYVAYIDQPTVATLPDNTPEEILLAKVIALAKITGWKAYHTRDSRKSEPGFPDLVLTNGEDVLIWELKDNRRKPTVDQERWLNLFQHTGKVEAGLYRPRDWPAIVERLTRKRSAPHDL